MTAVRFYLSGRENEDHVIKSLYEGCPETKQLVEGFEYEPSDVAVVFGVYKSQVPVSFPRGRVIGKQKARNLTNLILETGYIKRGSAKTNYYAAGLNGINGRADFRNEGMPDDRSRKIDVPLRPWWGNGEKVLLCGQVPWDASVDHHNHLRWLVEAATVLQSLTKRTIVFRPHPLAKLPNLTGCELSDGRPIEEELREAHVVVTFNSNCGVDAILNGVPVYAFDQGSMVYRIANKNWMMLEHPKMPERQQWFNDICYCQWMPDEMANGETWKHLFRK